MLYDHCPHYNKTPMLHDHFPHYDKASTYVCYMIIVHAHYDKVPMLLDHSPHYDKVPLLHDHCPHFVNALMAVAAIWRIVWA